VSGGTRRAVRAAAGAAVLLAALAAAVPAPGAGAAEGAASMNTISRQFAGFTGDATELARRVDGMIADAAAPPGAGAPLAVVAPHAGYVYSGPVAGFAYRAVQGHTYDTVVVIGPSHRLPFTGLSVYDATSFETPLGSIPVDRELVGLLLGAHPNIAYHPGAHREEHSLEVQVPFLQRALPPFKLVMVVAGGRDPEADLTLVTRLAEYARGHRLLVVASSDLSHYHGYDEARRLDAVALRSIEAMDALALEKDVRAGRTEACGILPVLLTMEYARRMGARRGVLLRKASSGDTAGPRDQVVGYAALAFWADGAASGAGDPPAAEVATGALGRLDAAARRELLAIARRAVEETVRNGRAPEPETGNPALRTPQGAFVTIQIGGELRGCIGTFLESTPLYRTVSEMAVSAATQDPRFPPLSAAELPRIHLEISALTPRVPVRDVREIEVGRHGLYIQQGMRSGVLLPQVATEYGWDRTTFLEQTCRKAGLPRDAWKSGAQIWTFEAEVFGEEG